MDPAKDQSEKVIYLKTELNSEVGNYMTKFFELISIILVLTILALPVFGERGDSRDDNARMGYGNDDGIMSYDSMREKAREMHEKGREMRDTEGMMGMGFMHRNGNSYGNYVTFSVDNTTGEVLNYGISGVNIFNSVKVSNFDLKDIKTNEAITRITNKDSSVLIQIHDNPSTVINIITRSKASLIFNLSDGMNASKEDNIVKIAGGNLTAYIASINATSVNISGRLITVDLSSGHTIFRAAPVNMPVDMSSRNFMGEMMRKRAGAEISVGKSDKSSIVNYSDDMNVRIKSMERNRMRMIVNSENHSGKFLMMNIDNSSMMWNEKQRIRLYMDNQSMRQVMSEGELYDSNESCFWLNKMNGNRMQAIMYIQNFSERQIDIVVEDEGTATPSATIEAQKTAVPATATPKSPGFEIIIGLMGSAIAYRLKRKYKR